MDLRLKCGSGPVHISGQHLVAVEEDAESEDEEVDVKLLSMSGKQSAPGGGKRCPRKKVKLAADEDDDEDDDGDDFDEEEAEEICMSHSSQECSEVKPGRKRLKIIDTKIQRSQISKNKTKEKNS